MEILVQRTNQILTSKKTRDVARAFTAPSNMATASKRQWGETAMSKGECFLSEIPPSYRPKAKKLMHAWSQRGMTWDNGGNIYLKGKAVKGAIPRPLLHHTSSGRRRNLPTGFGHVTQYMTAKHLPSTVYTNPRWRGELWYNYTPSESSTECNTQDKWKEDTETEKETDITRGTFPEWQDLT